MAARVDAGHELGALLVLLMAVLLLAGLAVGFFTAARPPSERAGDGSAACCSPGSPLVPVAVVLARSAAPGGLSAADAATPGAGSSTRRRRPPQHARPPHRHLLRARPLLGRGAEGPRQQHIVGTGAGAYATVRNRYRQNGDIIVRHAHGYGRQTLADLGLVGARALAPGRDWPGCGRPRGRSACAAATAGWPSTPSASGPVDAGLLRRDRLRRALLDRLDLVRARQRRPALLCAGWVAGRGPLRERLADRRLAAAGRRSARAPAPTGTAAARARGRRGATAAPCRRCRRSCLASPPAGPSTSPCARCTRATRRSIASTRAPSSRAALDRADRRRPQPAVDRPAVRARGHPTGPRPDARGRGRAEAGRPTSMPASAEAWRRLGRFRLDVLAQPRTAPEGLPGRLLPRSAEPDLAGRT